MKVGGEISYIANIARTLKYLTNDGGFLLHYSLIICNNGIYCTLYKRANLLLEVPVVKMILKIFEFDENPWSAAGDL